MSVVAVLFLGFQSRAGSLTEENSDSDRNCACKSETVRDSILTTRTTANLENANAYWVQTQLALSIYDSRREIFSGRMSPGLQVGTRFDKVGAFLNFELDRNFDINQRVERLDVLHVGPGVELLLFGGRMRSSFSAGLAILASDTDVETRGKRGWYFDLRPLSVRTVVGEGAILEITPLTLDASIPVPNGLPLIIFSHMTTISMEWATEKSR